MKKTELEQLLKDVVAQMKHQNAAHNRELRTLRASIEKLEKKREDDETPLDERAPKPEERKKRLMERVEHHKERALHIFRHPRKSDKAEKTPPIEEFVDDNCIDNLDGMDEATFIVLIRHHFNAELADAFATHRMSKRLYHSIVHYFDDYVDVEPLKVTDEMKAEAEQLRTELEKRREEGMLLKPTAGEFRLRGREELQTFFNEHVVDIVNHSADYARLGVRFPKGFILEGPPGCGKTFAVERLAEHLGWNVVRITSAEVGSSFIHETARKIEEKFDEAAENAPSILIIDEMDAFMPNRATLPGHNTHSKEEVDSFLKCLQTAEERHVLVAGMTNLISTLDPAVLRTGRMGTHVKVDMPSLAEVEDVLAYALEKRPHAEFALTPHAELLLNHPLSDVTHVVDEAAMCAARARHDCIAEADLAKAIARLLQRQGAQLPPHKPFGFAA